MNNETNNKMSTQNTQNAKNQLLQGEFLDFSNSQNDFIELSFHKDKFQLWLNGSIIKSLKSFKPIQEHLNFLLSK